MKKLLLNAGVALAGLLADPAGADAQHFTPEQLRAAAERSDKVNGEVEMQEDGGPEEGTDVKDIVGVIGFVLLGIVGAYGTSKVLVRGLKLLDKPQSSQSDDGSAPTEQQPPTPTDGEPTSPEAAESIVTGLDLVSSSLTPGFLLNSTEFRDQNGVEQEGIGWNLSSVEELATRTGKKAYRIDLTPDKNEHFDQLVISIFQSEASEDDDDYLVKAAFLKTNPDGTISAPYLVSLNSFNIGDKLDRGKLCNMVEEVMAQIRNYSKDETPVSSDLLKQVRDYVLTQDLVTTDSIVNQFPDFIPDQQFAGTVLALLRAEGIVGAVNSEGESEVVIPNPPTPTS